MSLNKYRMDIDKIDSEILKLLNKRAEIAVKVGSEKKGKEILVPAREQEIIEKLSEKNKGKFPKHSLKSIYGEIFATCRTLEQPLKVAYLGPATTFTHMAAIKKFGSNCDLVSKDSITDVFKAVEKKEAAYGVVPIENSTEGTVNHTLDTFVYSELNIVAEIQMEIKHHLLSKYSLNNIKKIYSHPQAIAQCKNWLRKKCPKAELIEESSTAKASEKAALYLDSASIGSELAAKEYGLNVIAKNIEDSAYNVTRFLVIGESTPKKSNKNKTSIMFTTKHKSGALFDALKPLKDNNLNMTKIESRPLKYKGWQYVFFVDFEGFIEDEKVKKALSEIEKETGFLRILGSYPEEANIE